MLICSFILLFSRSLVCTVIKAKDKQIQHTLQLLKSFFLSLCIAAWPRYRVLRVQELGQYNLEILSADLSDDSLYECQAPDAALRSRRAKLTVLSTLLLPPHTSRANLLDDFLTLCSFLSSPPR